MQNIITVVHFIAHQRISSLALFVLLLKHFDQSIVQRATQYEHWGRIARNYQLPSQTN